MPRRSSPSSKKGKTGSYVLFAILLVTFIVAGKIFLDKRAEHFSHLSELSITDMQEGATSLSGNEYRVSGKMTERIKWTADRGQLISIALNKKGNLPIYVPSGVDTINLEKGHNYTFHVEINREGFPIAKEVKAK